MAETKVCKKCGKYNSDPAQICIECGQSFPKPGMALLASNTGAMGSKIIGMSVGFVVVIITMITGWLIGNGFSSSTASLGMYGGLVIWVVIFKFRNEFSFARPVITWLFPYRK
jgi:hypothetical protein